MNIAQKTVEHYDMISSGDSLLVGVSGGPDSVALLLFLVDIDNNFNKYKNIGLAHINHCLRGEESDRDEEFVKELAKKYNLPFHNLKVDVPYFAKENNLSFEEAAREIRYSFYKDISQKENYNKIALGHNYDDNAELVLMNILRGSGTKGLSGIPPIRYMQEDDHVSSKNIAKNNIKIIRPLIEVPREQILNYLNVKQQSYMIDSSNDDTFYLRNRVRHSLIPKLKDSYNPSITDSLNRLSKVIMDENSFMEEMTEQILQKAIIYKEQESPETYENNQNSQIDIKYQVVDNEIVVDPKIFEDMHRALAKRLIRSAIEKVKGDLRRITFIHIEDILKLIYSKTGGKTIHLPDKIRIIKSRQSISFRKESKPLREIGSRASLQP
ncbi:MAG: tRNA lysidine(34) synthetase TilS [Desulfamplus sp.]|nr:tRNA lysidine(34) synthetase TilS [Desulfamplus sp.]